MHVSNALVLLCIRFLGCNNFNLNLKLAMFRQAVSAYLYITVIKPKRGQNPNGTVNHFRVMAVTIQ